MRGPKKYIEFQRRQHLRQISATVAKPRGGMRFKLAPRVLVQPSRTRIFAFDRMARGSDGLRPAAGPAFSAQAGQWPKHCQKVLELIAPPWATTCKSKETAR